MNAIAANVALGADVVVCNGHVPTRTLAGELTCQRGTSSAAAL